VARAIRYAADNGAKVINMSLGRNGGPAAPLIGEALRYAVGKGTFIAVAGGNDYEDGNPTERLAEQAGPIEGAMVVASVGRDMTRAHYSGVKSYIDIAAPGGNRRSGGAEGMILQQTYSPSATDTFLLPPSQFRAPRFDTMALVYYQGTSMATPHVAGMAALLMSQGITSPAAVEAAIKRFATEAGAAGRDDEYGSGIINPRATLRDWGWPSDAPLLVSSALTLAAALAMPLALAQTPSAAPAPKPAAAQRLRPRRRPRRLLPPGSPPATPAAPKPAAPARPPAFHFNARALHPPAVRGQGLCSTRCSVTPARACLAEGPRCGTVPACSSRATSRR
jgi:hypothetical protein